MKRKRHARLLRKLKRPRSDPEAIAVVKRNNELQDLEKNGLATLTRALSAL